jgi:hypothetical protein
MELIDHSIAKCLAQQWNDTIVSSRIASLLGCPGYWTGIPLEAWSTYCFRCEPFLIFNRGMTHPFSNSMFQVTADSVRNISMFSSAHSISYFLQVFRWYAQHTFEYSIPVMLILIPDLPSCDSFVTP